MKLNKKIVITILSLITFALAGLLGLQVFLLKHALELETRIFNQNVHSALDSIIKKLENQEALEAIAKQRPDLILMDIQLPIMDGYTATRRIKPMPR